MIDTAAIDRFSWRKRWLGLVSSGKPSEQSALSKLSSGALSNRKGRLRGGLEGYTKEVQRLGILRKCTGPWDRAASIE